VKAGTKYAVLGLLLERPSYGYEVLVRFRRAFDAGQWAITPQGLYASLDRLERDGLIEPIVDDVREASRRQPKTPYRVTADGEHELQRFLEAPIGPDPSRAEFLVRLQCAVMRDAEAILQMLDSYEDACLQELCRIGGTTGDGTPHRRSLIELLATEDRRLGIQARLMWIDFARQHLRVIAAAPDRETSVR
jgi:DNA-binding PadR family transcriptional regulator